MQEDLHRRLDVAEWVLKNSGFRRCDIPACNCGSWHHVGGFKARFDEVKDALEEKGYSMNGRTLLDTLHAALQGQFDLGFKLAQLHGDNGHLGSFIARGTDPMYQSVSLTDAGIAAAKSV